MPSHVKRHLALSTRDADLLRLSLQMSEFKQRVGQRIATAREKKGLTQTQLARTMSESIDGPTISRWETGKVYPEQHLDELAAALGVDAGDLLAPDPDPDTPDLMGTLSAEHLRDRLQHISDTVDEIKVLLTARPAKQPKPAVAARARKASQRLGDTPATSQGSKPAPGDANAGH